MAEQALDPVEIIARKICGFFDLDPDKIGFVMMDDGERAWAPMWHDDKARARDVISALTDAALAIRPVEPTDEMLFASPNVKNASELMKHAAILEARATYKAMFTEEGK